MEAIRGPPASHLAAFWPPSATGAMASDVPSHSRTTKMFLGWTYRLITWKWQYMHSMWTTLSEGGGIFLETLDVDELKKPLDAADDRDTALDSKDTAAIADAIGDRVCFNCETEAFRLFSEGVDEAHQWLPSCPCHDHIWSTQGFSRERQQQTFQHETGCKRC